MTGQGECCTNITSVLYFIEAWNRVSKKLSCTQVKCSWLMPTAVKDAPVSDIDFRSAKKLKQNLDRTINNLTRKESVNSCVRRDRFKQFLYWTEFLQSLCLWASFIFSLKLFFKEQKHTNHFRFIWQEVLRLWVLRSVRGMLKKIKFSNAATEHGCKHESVAIKAYEKVMREKHTNFHAKTCATFINQICLWLHAIPDFFVIVLYVIAVVRGVGSYCR